ncbi:hypothetical protein [Sphingomonas sp. UNC305MFCol5.2]|uniref:hypothetical protein n=1 Tax=Sphingomonas sp. UNC305MFCol5.2 TaxID=1449076 RepID=UPI0003F655F3|nr:hypothetical protein [Sphingomonas sp. UNC305MFCol5.2]
MKKVAFVIAAAMTCVATGAQAVDPHVGVGSAQYSIGISGFVPVICRATVDATAVPTQPGQVSLGSLNEFCNNPNGYEVYADYSPNLAKASLLVDGKKVPLGNAGSTRVSKSNRAGIVARSVSLDLPTDVQSGSISFRVVAL